MRAAFSDLRQLCFITALPSQEFKRPILVSQHGAAPDHFIFFAKTDVEVQP
jgi:hypothetical protein